MLCVCVVGVCVGGGAGLSWRKEWPSTVTCPAPPTPTLHHARTHTPAPPQGLRGVIPPNFPYLHVEFGLSEGFVHVVDEDEDHKFDTGLARSVMIGAAAGRCGVCVCVRGWGIREGRTDAEEIA